MSASRVAIVGCGVISGVYADTLSKLGFVRLAACVDALSDRATELAGRYDARALDLDAALADPDVDVVVNLTPPRAHAEVTRRALEAGKSVFSEKPLGVELGEGAALVDAARARGARLGCAPDTFLGAGLQTARAVIDRGDIGEPVAANAFMLQAGPEWWHPDPGLFYERGAGPLFDMGPYYFTTLVQLLGPARAVSAGARVSRATRTISSEPRRGALIDVEVPTHVSTVVEMASGPVATFVASFDVQASRYRNLEIYGTEGTLSVPDPNTFGGPVTIRRFGDGSWTEVDLVEANVPQQRGIGLADMVWAQRTGRAHRASDALALHVLEIMCATIESAEHGARVDLETTCERAAPLPVGLPPNTFDD
ncbi:MAG TPA: Gfo/Idh/MocA family oxidoreductase [Acidimicrobiia bacterium]